MSLMQGTGADTSFFDASRGAMLVKRVLAASFPDDRSARAARARLIDDFAIDASQIGVEALAHGRNDPDMAILAGRFHEDVVPAARGVVEEFGGTLVVDIDDRGMNA